MRNYQVVEIEDGKPTDADPITVEAWTARHAAEIAVGRWHAEGLISESDVLTLRVTWVAPADITVRPADIIVRYQPAQWVAS
jgi:hypothetical protein